MLFRLATESDAESLLALRLANRDHFQIAEARRPESFFTLASQRALLAESEGMMVGVFDGEAMAGYARLSNVVRGAFQNAYLGYAVGREHNNRGVGTLLVRHAVRVAFADHDLHRVQAAVRTDNPGSLRVLEKAGFRREGLALRYLNLDGDWRDHVLHAITREDPFEEPAADTAGAEPRQG